MGKDPRKALEWILECTDKEFALALRGLRVCDYDGI
jgi:hypothetical protein